MNRGNDWNRDVGIARGMHKIRDASSLYSLRCKTVLGSDASRGTSWINHFVIPITLYDKA